MLYLWVVPTEVRGTWQSSDLRVRIHQNYQELEVEGALGGRRNMSGGHGSVSGYEVTWEAKGVRFGGRVEGAGLVGDLLIDGRAESVDVHKLRYRPEFGDGALTPRREAFGVRAPSPNSKDFPRVHQALRIEGLLQRAHQLDLHRRLVQPDLVALELAE